MKISHQHFDKRFVLLSISLTKTSPRAGTGLKFNELEQWVYSILLDNDRPVIAFGVQEMAAKQLELQLVKDSCYIRGQIQAQQEWFLTKAAAAKLGISREQLRKLRLNGMFKSVTTTETRVFQVQNAPIGNGL